MQKDLKFLHIITSLLLCATTVIAQEQEFSLTPLSGLEGRVETQYSFSEGTTPLWLNANKYGMSSLESHNAHVRMKAERKINNDSAKQWGIGYAADLALAIKKKHTFTTKRIIQVACLYSTFITRIITSFK